MLELWSWPTPNGHKVHIALEELGLEYKVIPVDIGAGDQFKPEFLKITPNHRIPAIVDPEGPGGKPFTLFESAAILIYLSEKTGGKLIPKDPVGRYKCLEWMMFQMGGVGPIFAQRNHFGAYARAKIPYAIERYTNEVKRLTRVLERRLADAPTRRRRIQHGRHHHLSVDLHRRRASSRFAERGYIDLTEYPAVRRWHDEIAARPAVRRGLAVLSDAQRDARSASRARNHVRRDPVRGSLTSAARSRRRPSLPRAVRYSNSVRSIASPILQ